MWWLEQLNDRVVTRLRAYPIVEGNHGAPRRNGELPDNLEGSGGILIWNGNAIGAARADAPALKAASLVVLYFSCFIL